MRQRIVRRRIAGVSGVATSGGGGGFVRVVRVYIA